MSDEEEDVRSRKAWPEHISIVTETRYPFTDMEVALGIILDSEDLKTFWVWLSKPTALMDPYFDYVKEARTPQQLAREIALRCEKEISLHAYYMALFDQMKNSRTVDASMYVSEFRTTFQTWLAETKRILVMKNQLKKMTTERTDNLKNALKTAPKTGSWFPSEEIINAIKGEINEMKRLVVMTPYYRMQSAWCKETKRPFFNFGEIYYPSGVTSQLLDQNSSHPIKGESMQERRRAMAAATHVAR